MNIRLAVIIFLLCYAMSVWSEEISDRKISRILYINSYHRGYIWSDGIESGLRQRLNDSGRKTDVKIEFLDAKLFPDPPYFPTLAEVFAMKHGKIRYDAVVVSDNEAFDFAVRYREQLFPHAPIIFCGYNSFRPEVLRGITNVTGVNEEIDFAGTIDMALTVHPKTQTLVFITSDYYTAGQRNQQIVENTLIPAYQKKYKIMPLKNLYLKDIEQQLAALPPRTLVFIFGAPLDNRESQLIAAEEYYHRMAAASSAPAYSFWDFVLNTGMMGGNMLTGPDQGRMAAELTLRILDGTPADSIPVVMDSPTSKIFDFNGMKRFGISENALPAGSIVINKPNTFYQRYKPYVWITITVFMTLSAMVMLLIILLRKSRVLGAKLRQHQEDLGELVSERTAELRRANETLHEREALFHGMFDKHSAVMLLIEPETGKIFLANQAAMKYYGYTAQEFETLTIYQINQSDKGEIASEMLNASIEKRNYFSFPHRLAGGEIRNAEVHSSPVPFKGKTLLFSIVHDITARRQAEETLRESEERLRRIFENVPIGMFQSTPEGKFIYVNPALSAMLGYASPDELISTANRTSVADAIYEFPERRPVFMKNVGHTRSKWNVFENRYRCKDGRVIDAILSFGEREDPTTGQYFLYGFIQDITDRKRTEDALKESEERFRLFIDNSPAPAWMKDEQGRCVYLNRVCEKVFGMRIEEHYGKTDYELYPPEIAEKLRENDLKVLDTNQSIETIEQSLTMDGKVIYGWVFKFPFTDKHGSRFVCGIGVDITERIRAEEELIKAKEAAEAANLAKSAFLANMSHELRTPLNAILGYAQFLQKDPVMTEHQKERLAIIHKSGEHLLSLINDILDLSKIEAGRIELSITEFFLPDFLNNIAGMFKIRAEQKGIEFYYKTWSRLPKYVSGDEIRIRQILINLLGNAVKFTEKGSVTFGTEYRDGRICFEVRDTGPGIEAGDLEKIFDPFHQIGSYLKKNEGTGLGLSISRKLTEIMGGSLTVQSTTGQGTIFRVGLELPPFGSAEHISESEDSSGITGYKGVRRKILIADDISENRFLLADLLTPLGFGVSEADDGKMAAELAKKLQPDLILMDLFMPGTDGFEAVRIIREEEREAQREGRDLYLCPSVPIIAVSASAFGEHILKSREAGCDDFISKPVAFEQLLAKMEKYLDLEWIYRKAEDTADEKAPIIAPCPEELESLAISARMGDIQAIRERAELLIHEDKQLVPFAEELIHLAKEFQMSKIRTFLKLFRK